VQLDDAGFRRRFAGSPIKRTGRDRFVRNVLIAIGNSGQPSLGELVEARLADPSPLVRAMAVWALSRLRGRAAMAAYAQHWQAERDPAVLEEWRDALA
jgi:epoxyqueuosine reductase